MTKRLIDVDDTKLEAVRAVLETTTLKATIDAALDEVLALQARRETLIGERHVGGTGLADPEQRHQAWG
jgi:Arc/MetJ family transcription regulator